MQDHRRAPAARASRVAKISSIASLSPSGSRAWITIGRSSSRAISIWAAKARRWSSRAAPLAVVVEPGLADRPHLLVRRRAGRSPPPAASSKPAASLGWRPTLAKTSSWRSAAAIAAGFGLRVQADGEHPRRRPPRAPPRPARPRPARRGRGGCGSRSPARLSLPRRSRNSLSSDGRPRRLLPRDLPARPRRRDAGDPGLGRRAGARAPWRRWSRGRPTTSAPAPAARTRCAPTARPSAGAGSCRGCCATSPSATSRPRARHGDAGAAAAGPDRRPEGRPRGGRAGDAPAPRPRSGCR